MPSLQAEADDQRLLAAHHVEGAIVAAQAGQDGRRRRGIASVGLMIAARDGIRLMKPGMAT